MDATLASKRGWKEVASIDGFVGSRVDRSWIGMVKKLDVMVS
jgi:hypothetical protein